MAKIIELTGSPGVGKSTLYKEIEKQYKKENSWLPAHYLFPRARLNYQSVIKFIKNLSNIIQGSHGKVGTVGYLGARKRFVSEHKDYMDLCWNSIMIKQRESLNGVDLRIEKAQHLSQTIENIGFIQECDCDKYAILEEGLIHLIDILCLSNEPEEINSIINVMPLPHALINIQTEVSENVRRLMQRGSVITMHESLNIHQLEHITRQSQERRRIINLLIQDKGIPVLDIDAQEEVKGNADKIISFVENLKIVKSSKVKSMQ